MTTTSLSAGLAVVVGAAGDAGIKTQQGGGLHHILGFSFGQSFLDVQQHQFLTKCRTGDIIGTGSAYGACAYNRNFHL